MASNLKCFTLKGIFVMKTADTAVWLPCSRLWPLFSFCIFTIFALSTGFPLSKINIENTGNQNHPDLKVRLVLVTCIFNIDFF